MDILYVSTLLSEELNSKTLNELKFTDGQQDQKFHRLFVEGLVENGCNVETISSLRSLKKKPKNFNFPAGKENVGGVTYNYIKYIKNRFIRRIHTYFQTLKLIKKWKKNNKDGIILCEQRFSMLKACIHARKLFGVKVYGIVTDLPIYHISTITSRGLKSAYHKIYSRSRMRNTKKCDGFVLLTDQMNNVINKKNKPYVIIEGFADVKMTIYNNEQIKKYDKKVCHYAGKVIEMYGIKMLVNAFLDADIPNSELHVFGGGSYVEELAEISKKHSNIKYLGFRPNEEVVEDQLRSHLLINPRFTNYEYTKYSFPSKIMEYMASGTPLLTTALAGIPNEYYEYIYVLEEETEVGLSKKLKEVLKKSSEELNDMGLKAKKFIMENKSNVFQAKKVIKMIKDN